MGRIALHPRHSLVVFCFCYAPMIAIMGAAPALARRPVARQLTAASPVTPTPFRDTVVN